MTKPAQQIPAGWKVVRFDECVNLLYGSNLPKDKREDGSIPVYGSNGITDYHTESLVKGPGIIIGRKGSIGLVHWSDQDFWPIDTTYYVADDNNKNLRWAYYKLQTLGLEKMNTASGIPGLNRNEVYSLKIAIPPSSEQNRIAAILSKVDEEIEKVERIIEQTEKLKKGLMQKLLTKGIGHTKFKQTELGEIPEEWEVVRLKEIAAVERGKFSHRPRNDKRFYEGDMPFIQTGDIVNCNGKIKKYTQTLNEQGLAISRKFAKGTIVLTIAANIGDTGILTFESCFPDSLVGINVTEKMDNEFLEYYLRTRKAYLNKISTQSAQKNINLEKLRPLLIIKPSKDEQQEIARILNSLETKISNIQNIKSQFLKLKKGLMNDLLSGNVRVNNN